MTADPQAWGVDSWYFDYAGNENHAPAATIAAILNEMGAVDDHPSQSAPLVLTHGQEYYVHGQWHIALEGGQSQSGEGHLPQDLPLGYHRLSIDGSEQMLVVAPAKCLAPPDQKIWGWAMQLYASRSSRSWGIGDLRDLREFGALASGNGAELLLLNPLHAALVGEPQENSPYFPSSRSFRNPLYICVDEISGTEMVPEVAALAEEARRLNEQRIIDRNEVWRLKLAAFEAIWSKVGPTEQLERYMDDCGDALVSYATFCVLTEEFGRLWRQWPAELRHPQSEAVAKFRTDNNERVRFHAWLQMLLDTQLETASQSIPLVNDLAIGVDPGGADAWLWQDALALDMRVGAPPDQFNTLGQNWSLPPLDPWRLQGLEYEPFIQTVRANMKHASALRIDHVMGLFRLFWIPSGESPTFGTYVRYPANDLLSIVALESHRNGTYVVGEDLGTVEPEARAALSGFDILSYRLMLFEETQPHGFPERSMAAFTTHDLPTMSGLWSGRDLQIQNDLELQPNEADTQAMLTKLDTWAGNPTNSSEAIVAIHRLLAQASSALVTATLEDLLEVEERPNYPGTTTEYPNWSVALPALIDSLATHEGFKALSEMLNMERKRSN
jgi:4-alpha-glucanotransferase